ncbi:hypothetical protein BZA70DRAFT_304514 [Myxozyma melibiosi]|uniref:Uncharacterized protein n=1 Tax=Myxozyma melibiosi TaxID=54550 RepID=A0ABR1F6Z8_9ASCO
MPDTTDDEKAGLYLYSVPPPYADDEDEAGPSSMGSSASSNINAPSTAAERQSFLPRGLVRHEPDSTDGNGNTSIDLSTPRSSTESAAALQREIVQMDQMDIIEPPQLNLLRPSISSRVVTSIQKRLSSMGRFRPRMPRIKFPRITLFDGMSQRFTFLAAIFYSISLNYHTITSTVSNAFNKRLESLGNPLLIKRLSIVFLLTVGMWAIVASDLIPLNGTGPGYSLPPRQYGINDMRRFFFQSVEVELLSEQLHSLAKIPHLAGTSGDVAVAVQIQKYLLDMKTFDEVEMTQYEVYSTFPDASNTALQLLSRNGKRDGAATFEVSFEANLTEPEAVPGMGSQEPFAFHALSAAGDVTGHIVYANYCTRKDMAQLKEYSVKLNDSIVFCRYGLVHESLKIKLAELYGAAGVVLFRDKASSDMVSYPNGTAIPEDAVQRGSAGLRNWAPGDPLSEGFPSTPVSARNSKENSTALVHIASIPISWSNAKQFLAALDGYGTKVPSWKTNFDGVDAWYTGSEDGPRAHLVSSPVEKERHPIYNVVAKIEGMEQADQIVIIGAHRDSFCYGASDAMSGTSVMLEVARILGYLKSGYSWRPRRTIYFISWDGTEENLMGSTEWVEDNIEKLRRGGAAYINLDQAISGSVLRATGDPLLESIFLRSLNYLTDPFHNATLRHLWGKKQVSYPEGDRDTLPFQSYAGIASIDLGFASPGGFPTRTCFDNLEWMNSFGDPSEVQVGSKLVELEGHFSKASDGNPYVYHKLLTQLVGSMTITLCDEMNLPFDFAAYARAVIYFANDLQSYAGQVHLDISKIREAAAELQKSAVAMDKWIKEWMDEWVIMAPTETAAMAQHRFSRNSRMINFEKHLLDLDGVPGRSWFKHVLFAPQQWPPADPESHKFFATGTLAAVRDAIEQGDKEEAQKQLDEISAVLLAASKKLVN